MANKNIKNKRSTKCIVVSWRITRSGKVKNINISADKFKNINNQAFVLAEQERNLTSKMANGDSSSSKDGK